MKTNLKIESTSRTNIVWVAIGILVFFLSAWFGTVRSADAPVLRVPVVREPVIREPVIREPVIREPVVREPVVREPVVRTPVVRTPVVRTPVVREPVIRAPVVRTPVVRTPAKSTPTLRPALTAPAPRPAIKSFVKRGSGDEIGDLNKLPATSSGGWASRDTPVPGIPEAVQPVVDAARGLQYDNKAVQSVIEAARNIQNNLAAKADVRTRIEFVQEQVQNENDPDKKAALENLMKGLESQQSTLGDETLTMQGRLLQAMEQVMLMEGGDGIDLSMKERDVTGRSSIHRGDVLGEGIVDKLGTKVEGLDDIVGSKDMPKVGLEGDHGLGGIGLKDAGMGDDMLGGIGGSKDKESMLENLDMTGGIDVEGLMGDKGGSGDRRSMGKGQLNPDGSVATPDTESAGYGLGGDPRLSSSAEGTGYEGWSAGQLNREAEKQRAEGTGYEGWSKEQLNREAEKQQTEGTGYEGYSKEQLKAEAKKQKEQMAKEKAAREAKAAKASKASKKRKTEQERPKTASPPPPASTPNPEGVTIRRLTDKELAALADAFLQQFVNPGDPDSGIGTTKPDSYREVVMKALDGALDPYIIPAEDEGDSGGGLVKTKPKDGLIDPPETLDPSGGGPSVGDDP